MPGNHYDLPKNPLDAYLTTALFTDHPGEGADGNYTDQSYLDLGYGVHDGRPCPQIAFSSEAVAEAAADVQKFLDILDWLGLPHALEGKEPADLGMHLWFTRNGHGCGFWDGDYPINGGILTRIAHTFPELTPCLDPDSGKIIFERA